MVPDSFKSSDYRGLTRLSMTILQHLMYESTEQMKLPAKRSARLQK